MNLLATVSGGKDEATARVKDLHAKFPKGKFSVSNHDLSHQINLDSYGEDLDTATMDRMKRVASGSEPVRIKTAPAAAIQKPVAPQPPVATAK